MEVPSDNRMAWIVHNNSGDWCIMVSATICMGCGVEIGNCFGRLSNVKHKPDCTLQEFK